MDADEGEAGLFGPTGGNIGYGPLAGGFERGPEVGGGGVAVLVRLHVGAQAVAELVVAEEVFQHTDEGLALVVGDLVELALGIHLGGNGLLDGMCRGEGVAGESGLLVRGDVVPVLPVGVEVVGGGFTHPFGKPFVEPEVVPPGHRDKVAEPLVGHLVGDDLEDAFLLGLRTGGGVEEEGGFREDDAAPVFHRAAEAAAAGDGDEVELGEREFEPEVVVVVVEDFPGGFEGVLAVLHATLRGDDADFGAVGLALDGVEVADGEDHEVAGHRGSGIEVPIPRVSATSDDSLVGHV